MRDIFADANLDSAVLRQSLAGDDVYLVGGSVRDLILNRPIHDFDFAVQRGAIKLAFRVGDALGLPAFVLDRERDIGRVMLADGVTTLDFARFRRADGAFGGSLEEDLRGRDFTMNAIALDVEQAASLFGQADSLPYIDPTGGLADIQNKIVRMTHPDAIEQDPARALRAIRMALKFEFVLEQETQTAIHAMAGQMWRISAERVRDEFLKLLPFAGSIAELHRYGLLNDIAPEVSALDGVEQSAPHTKDVFWHTVSVLRQMSAVDGQQWVALEKLENHLQHKYDGGVTGSELLRLGALFHDIGKAKTQTVEADGKIRFLEHEHVGAMMAETRMKQLKFSKEATDRVRTIVRGHMRPLHLAQVDELSPRAIYRYFHKLGDAGVEVALLSIADHLGTYGDVGDEESWQALTQVVATLLDYYFERKEVVKPEPLIDGKDLIRMGLKPGPLFGRILATITESQAAGEITTRDQALAMAQTLASQTE